jgi:hypothetical protein
LFRHAPFSVQTGTNSIMILRPWARAALPSVEMVSEGFEASNMLMVAGGGAGTVIPFFKRAHPARCGIARIPLRGNRGWGCFGIGTRGGRPDFIGTRPRANVLNHLRGSQSASRNAGRRHNPQSRTARAEHTRVARRPILICRLRRDGARGLTWRGDGH